jgi:hypothetical protein
MDLPDFLRSAFDDYRAFLAALGGTLGDIVRRRNDDVAALCRGVTKACERALGGDRDRAMAALDYALRAVTDDLLSVSARHSRTVLGPQQFWYRIAAWEGAERREHMFHLPFQYAQGNYRFSTPGASTLYLANSVYLSWLECDEPEQCVVARFRVDSTGFAFLDLPCTHKNYVQPLEQTTLLPDIDPRNVTNGPYENDVTTELGELLIIWPLLLAVSVPRSGDDARPEYVIPQLLMSWVRRSETFLGVRYFTSRGDEPMAPETGGDARWNWRIGAPPLIVEQQKGPKLA